MSELLSKVLAAGAFTLIGAFISGATYFFTRWNNYRTLSAKYRDRLYELNKLGVQYGDVAYEFMNPANFTGSYFAALYGTADESQPTSPAALQLAVRVRSYILFRLNFYEEVFYATEASHVVFEDRDTWRSYLISELHRSLVREVLEKEQGGFGKKFLVFAGIRQSPLEKTGA